MGELCQVHFLDLLVNKFCLDVPSHSFDIRVELQMLLHCKVMEYSVELRAVSDEASSFVKTSDRTHILPAHIELAIIGDFFASQALKSCRLSRTSDT